MNNGHLPNTAGVAVNMTMRVTPAAVGHISSICYTLYPVLGISHLSHLTVTVT